MESMKAVRIHQFGGQDTLQYEEAPRPEPREDDVLIRAHAASVNPIDVMVRAGYMKDWFSITPPLIPGFDVSGTIAAAGLQVTNFEIGTPVFARADGNRNGTYAEYVAVRAADVVRKPQSLDHVHAAAVPHAGLTAWQALFEVAQLTAGQTILIHGAAGGVGHFAVQFAKGRGARVIATASSHNHAFLRELGADELIDYTATRFEEVVHDVDIVIDTVGGETQQRSWTTLKPGGMLASTVQPPAEESALAHGVRSAFVVTQGNVGQLAEIGKLIDAGQVRPVVSTNLALQDARQAHALIEAKHTRGKIVLQILN